MLRTADFLKFLITLGALVAFATQAYGRAADSEEREAERWLKKIHLAAQTLNYSGTFIYQQGSQIRSSRITHIVEGRNEVEKLEVLDGKPREYIRKNEEVVYYVPEEKTVWVEERLTREGFPAILASDPATLGRYYRVHFGASDRVAGFDCQVLSLQPKDNLRYGYRLWVEKSSGLLLRAQTVDNNQVIEQISFTQLALGNLPLQLIKPSYGNMQGWRVERAVIQHVAVPDLKIGFLPPGFKQIGAVKRLASPAIANDPAVDGAQASSGVNSSEVVQIVFSDGLAAISLFIEPGSQSRTEGAIQQGGVNIIGKRLGEFWLTIVGEVPAVTIKRVANSVEFKAINKSEP